MSCLQAGRRQVAPPSGCADQRELFRRPGLAARQQAIEAGTDHGLPAICPLILPDTLFSGQMRLRVGNRHVTLIEANIHSDDANWIDIGYVGPEDTGFPRNHNPGFLTDNKGYMLSDDEVTVYLTPAVTGENWLWSYDLYSAKFLLNHK